MKGQLRAMLYFMFVGLVVLIVTEATTIEDLEGYCNCSDWTTGSETRIASTTTTTQPASSTTTSTPPTMSTTLTTTLTNTTSPTTNLTTQTLPTTTTPTTITSMTTTPTTTEPTTTTPTTTTSTTTTPTTTEPTTTTPTTTSPTTESTITKPTTTTPTTTRLTTTPTTTTPTTTSTANTPTTTTPTTTTPTKTTPTTTSTANTPTTTIPTTTTPTTTTPTTTSTTTTTPTTTTPTTTTPTTTTPTTTTPTITSTTTTPTTTTPTTTSPTTTTPTTTTPTTTTPTTTSPTTTTPTTTTPTTTTPTTTSPTTTTPTTTTPTTTSPTTTTPTTTTPTTTTPTTTTPTTTSSTTSTPVKTEPAITKPSTTTSTTTTPTTTTSTTTTTAKTEPAITKQSTTTSTTTTPTTTEPTTTITTTTTPTTTTPTTTSTTTTIPTSTIPTTTTSTTTPTASISPAAVSPASLTTAAGSLTLAKRKRRHITSNTTLVSVKTDATTARRTKIDCREWCRESFNSNPPLIISHNSTQHSATHQPTKYPSHVQGGSAYTQTPTKGSANTPTPAGGSTRTPIPDEGSPKTTPDAGVTTALPTLYPSNEPKWGLKNPSIALKMYVNDTFSQDLKNKTSDMFIKYSESFKKLLTALFNHTYGVKGVEIKEFIPGSIGCKFDVLVNAAPKAVPLNISFLQQSIEDSAKQFPETITLGNRSISIDKMRSLSVILTATTRVFSQPCKSFHVNCSYNTVCVDHNAEFVCIHKCDTHNICSKDGECFVDKSGTVKCRCREDSMYVYKGDTCKEKVIVFFSGKNTAIIGACAGTVIACLLIVIFLGARWKHKRMEKATDGRISEHEEFRKDTTQIENVPMDDVGRTNSMYRPYKSNYQQEGCSNYFPGEHSNRENIYEDELAYSEGRCYRVLNDPKRRSKVFVYQPSNMSNPEVDDLASKLQTYNRRQEMEHQPFHDMVNTEQPYAIRRPQLTRNAVSTYGYR